MLTITRKTLLYKSKVEYADYALNHVEGCAHGCRYPCYAYLLKKRTGKIQDYADWCQPKLVSNALELLDKELPKYRDRIRNVHLCFTTDPFMFGEPEVSELSLKLIDKLNQNNIRCTVLTKGVYPIELGCFSAASRKNEYGITLVSLEEKFRQEYEPHAAPVIERLDALRYLHHLGFFTWVSIEPYPTPYLDPDLNLSRLLDAISFVDRIVFGRWNYNPEIAEFKPHNEFYANMVKLLIKFCDTHQIAYHIKAGTIKSNEAE